MPKERMDHVEFFALPEQDPEPDPSEAHLCSGFGIAGLREEGAPLYRDEDGFIGTCKLVARVRCGVLWYSSAS